LVTGANPAGSGSGVVKFDDQRPVQKKTKQKNPNLLIMIIVQIHN
jgi:hypothetical protein